MDTAHMLQSVLPKKVTHLKSEDEIRYLILYQKERLLHEDVENMTGHSIPIKFINIPDEERRGMIRALRWLVDDRDEDWV